MKLTTEQLRKIIKEELEGVLSEKDIKILSKKHHIIILGRGDYK